MSRFGKSLDVREGLKPLRSRPTTYILLYWTRAHRKLAQSLPYERLDSFTALHSFWNQDRLPTDSSGPLVWALTFFGVCVVWALFVSGLTVLYVLGLQGLLLTLWDNRIYFGRMPRAFDAARDCDLLLCIGSTLSVYPAAAPAR